jgi:hypothetical protein
MNHHQCENSPSWVRKIDSFSRKKEMKMKARRGEYIAAIIFNLIFLWIIHHVLDWNPGFIRDNFSVVIWILDVNILIQIAGNMLMLMLALPVIRYLSLAVMESASFVTQMVLFYIYPFDFSHFHSLSWLDQVIPIMLIIGMGVSALKVISNLWKLAFRRS